ncbi:hypothetical protein CPLU01_10652 [Colletotrichum plurivorum]|uniref:Uncharacterized protein n=1 Tax=Colletotrichum plurivorum TaxID=2175906 RepID=A0A8H6K4X6_9PEZI|nr:hypothetical protein CPLU01_10652 [Colletotrichum plurivorum]
MSIVGQGEQILAAATCSFTPPTPDSPGSAGTVPSLLPDIYAQRVRKWSPKPHSREVEAPDASERAVFQNREQKVLKEVTDDEQKDKASCHTTATCVLCIGAAGAAGTGVVASCTATALGEEALTAAPSGGLTTWVVIAQWVACVSKPVAAFLVATAVCLKSTGGH